MSDQRRIGLVLSSEALFSMPSDEAPMVDWALWYASKGIPVFPVRPKQKVPIIKDWVNRASTDPATLEEWWKQHPQANIGGACGHVMDVLDEDWGGAETIRENGGMPTTLAVTTPSGGAHHYLQPTGKKNSVRRLPGLDFRAQGGYVLLPPSYIIVHLQENAPEGSPKRRGYEGRYRWSIPIECTSPAQAPGWLLNSLEEQRSNRTRKSAPVSVETNPDIADEATRGEDIPEGRRDDTLLRIACSYASRGYSKETLSKKLHAVNQSRCKPPLHTRDVDRIVRQAWEYLGTSEATIGKQSAFKESYPLSDVGNARRFAKAYSNFLRWCPGMGKWIVWNGSQWVCNEDGRELAIRFAMDVAESIARNALEENDRDRQIATLKWAEKTQERKRLDNMVELAKAMEGMTVRYGDLDASHELLNVANGTIHLPTGELRPHWREDLITRMIPIEYDPQASCHRWESFLREVVPDEELRSFLKKAMGYSLGGTKSEQCFFFLYGRSGNNGKSTITQTLRHVLGPYARATSVQTFVQKRIGTATNDLARLKNARLVIAPEWPEGSVLDEALMKQLSGEDAITARHLYQEPFEFVPGFVVWVVGNHYPEIDGTDEAMWRRIRLIPFDVSVPLENRDPLLKEKLREEGAGILRWLVEGHRAWRKHGLKTPTKIVEANASHREDSDPFGDFLKTHVREAWGKRLPAKALFDAYRAWSIDHNERALSANMVGRIMKVRGFESGRTGSYRYYTGIRLTAQNYNDNPETPE